MWCPLNVNNFKVYQHNVRQTFELVKYGGYTYADVETMAVFERSYLHAILLEVLAEEVKGIQNLYK
ncbi:unnamed protein product [marine sediment metagenome]|uniref:Uncharacterized protein n=1 Tax=marine sediment metagenome TaxID=412755 RepID=X0VML1_9ZZZZ